MNTLLFVWAVVAAPSPVTQFHEWKLLAEVKSLDRCEKIAKELNISKEKYRCVRL